MLGHFLDCDGIKKVYNKIPSRVKLKIDSRSLASGDAFLALKGEKFDGHDFIMQAISQGASLIILDRLDKLPDVSQHKEVGFILVEDTLRYFVGLGQMTLKNWKQKAEKQIIGITGSCGKTTQKEMLYFLMDGIFSGQVHTNYKNFNNQIGLTLTLLELKEEHNYLILELGTNHPGEIKHLSSLAQPNHGIITCIGLSHLEHFKNQENVFTEKRSLFDFCNQSDQMIFMLNADDDYLKRLMGGPKTFAYTFHKTNADRHFFIDYNAQKNSINFKLEGQGYQIINSNIMGEHNFRNLAQTTLLAMLLFKVYRKELVAKAQEFLPSFNRSSWSEYKQSKVFLDAYNANPTSMQHALKAFCEKIKLSQQKLEEALFVVGSMNELGENAPLFHQEIGSLMLELGIQNAVFVGPYAADYQKGFKLKSSCYPTVHDFKKEQGHFDIAKYKYIFIKGSRSYQLESIINSNGH